jgi:hypothetical protein
MSSNYPDGVLHPKCGKRFPDTPRTGHCSGCCETFYGIAAFDEHQRRGDAGRVQCLAPAEGDQWHRDELDRWHLVPSAADLQRLAVVTAARRMERAA